MLFSIIEARLCSPVFAHTGQHPAASKTKSNILLCRQSECERACQNPFSYNSGDISCFYFDNCGFPLRPAILTPPSTSQTPPPVVPHSNHTNGDSGSPLVNTPTYTAMYVRQLLARALPSLGWIMIDSLSLSLADCVVPSLSLSYHIFMLHIYPFKCATWVNRNVASSRYWEPSSKCTASQGV